MMYCEDKYNREYMRLEKRANRYVSKAGAALDIVKAIHNYQSLLRTLEGRDVKQKLNVTNEIKKEETDFIIFYDNMFEGNLFQEVEDDHNDIYEKYNKKCKKMIKKMYEKKKIGIQYKL